MLTLFGNLDSGNCHKAQVVLAMADLPFRRVDVSQPRGEPRTPAFLALNPMGKVPALLLPDGDVLTESGAILYHYAEAAGLWPATHRTRSECLRWMFFEQYSHEPALAVMRYLRRFAGDPDAHAAELARLRPKALAALTAMQTRLAARDWLAGDAASIADVALYPYTRMAPESGVEIAAFPAVAAWLPRVEALPGLPPVYADAAVQVLGYEQWFGSAESA